MGKKIQNRTFKSCETISNIQNIYNIKEEEIFEVILVQEFSKINEILNHRSNKFREQQIE